MDKVFGVRDLLPPSIASCREVSSGVNTTAEKLAKSFAEWSFSGELEDLAVMGSREAEACAEAILNLLEDPTLPALGRYLQCRRLIGSG